MRRHGWATLQAGGSVFMVDGQTTMGVP